MASTSKLHSECTTDLNAFVGIMHGDVKPENVLIFKTEHNYTASTVKAMARSRAYLPVTHNYAVTGQEN